MAAASSKIIVALIAVVVGCGAVILLSQSGHDKTDATAATTSETVHTTAWYVAHPNIAKQDEARCGDNAALISQAACQNDASAENQILENELGNAAVENGAASNTQPQKAQ